MKGLRNSEIALNSGSLKMLKDRSPLSTLVGKFRLFSQIHRKGVRFLLFVLCGWVSLAATWNNGPAGNASTGPGDPDCLEIPYSTHDWIADHARAMLPSQERAWIDEHIRLFLLGTEAPDNDRIPDACGAPGNGYDDRLRGHSVEWDEDFSGMIKDRAAFRAKDEFLNAEDSLRQGKVADAAYFLGAMAHYIGDLSQYGHTVSFEKNHSNYEGLIARRTGSFQAGNFESHILPDGLEERDPYDAARDLSLLIVQGGGDIRSARWMDDNYGNREEEFWRSVGASLNAGVNYLADVLHTFYVRNRELIDDPSVSPPPPRNYIVQPGDTLGSIARELLGDGRRWRRIYAANRDRIEDPHELTPGMELVIP